MFVKSCWMHPSDLDGSREHLENVFSRLAKHGFSKVFLFVKNSDGTVIFRTRNLEVHSTMSDLDEDPLENAIMIAHDFNIEVHPTFVVFCEGNWRGLEVPSEPGVWLSKNLGLAQCDRKGEPILRWADPAKAEVRRHEAELILEVIKNYDVDGIQLDYIRYPEEAEGCFCDYCRKTFKELHGIDPREVTRPDENMSKWVQWRAWNITSFVEELRLEVKRENARVKLSAAVFKDYPRCLITVAQDWPLWIKKGMIDFVCPMTYEYDSKVARYLAKNHRAAAGNEAIIYEGLGKKSSQSILTPREVLEQAEIFKEEGANGVAIFSYSSLNDEDLKNLDELGN
ncbi:MAG: family 10 glycosylhydrolase [Candidatus Bathyarchaeia archaeon]